ncbi:MAG: PhzF family phenazine biosynthesis protein, partial [Chloroflexota bacterium]
MPALDFLWVDAFTTVPFAGNPCAVVFDADDLDDETMQTIAYEFNLSETAFVKSSDHADVGARYFTPAEEIPLAGHPTISTIFALYHTGRFTPKSDLDTIQLELKAGTIPIDVETKDGQVQKVVMSQLAPQFLATFTPEEIMPIFGLSVDDLLPDQTIQVVSTGAPQMMIPLRSLDALRRARLVGLEAYHRLQREGEYFFGPRLFVLEGVTPAGDTFGRHFGVAPDVPEDPFTGSSTGGMAAYLWKYGLIEQPTFVAEQGHWMKRPGVATVEVVGPRDSIETVRIGGSAVAVM